MSGIQCYPREAVREAVVQCSSSVTVLRLVHDLCASVRWYIDIGNSDSEETEFQHKHFYYVFSNRPRKLEKQVENDPICPATEEKKKRKFKRVYNGTVCMYVCQHEDI